MKPAYIFLCMAVALPLAAQEPAAETDTYFPQQMTAKDLLFTCSSSSLTSTGRQRQRYCYGFISGVEESLRLLGRESGNGPCVPPGKTSRDFASVYVKYASRKNADLDKPAAMLVVKALEAAFPCVPPTMGE
jgi:hypothetical protein